MRVLVAGAGGFIGGHLAERLLDQGHEVRAVDVKPLDQWWQVHRKHKYARRLSCWPNCDLSLKRQARDACEGMAQVYNLAANMGGIGYIEANKAACMQSVLINTHLLQGAHEAVDVSQFFYASSACVYHADLQNDPNVTALREEDAYHNGGAMPEDGYGWEKLFSERMCRHFREDCGLETRVARFHNIYGPHGSWNDGREKAPAAICRKVAKAKFVRNHEISVWGDGTITRSFCYVDDAVKGIELLMESEVREPLNVGSSELISVGGLVSMVEEIAGQKMTRKYELTRPQGVVGRNSDNTKIKRLLAWEPTTPLRTGMQKTYRWIEKQVMEAES